VTTVGTELSNTLGIGGTEDSTDNN
jgi:hypothetical protein